MKILWTKQDIDYLKAHYPTTPIGEMSKHLGRTTQAISTKASALNLKRPIEFIKKQLSAGSKYRFKKGNSPHNKGKKWSEYMDESEVQKALTTCYKKGHLPSNTKEDGAITTRRDKSGRYYKYIRVSVGKWIPYHVYLWEQNYGKIPKGHAVVFKDNNSLNCELTNLECISRTELMNRNTIHRYPIELKRTIKLLKNVKSKLEPSK